MKRQTIIALGVAIVLGLVAVLLANTYLTGGERQIATAEPTGMVRVAVASMPLAYGADITPDCPPPWRATYSFRSLRGAGNTNVRGRTMKNFIKLLRNKRGASAAAPSGR